MRRRINQHIGKNAKLQILGGEEFYLELLLVPTWDWAGQRTGWVEREAWHGKAA